MNLELLDPFRRQIPDRIDSTLTIPPNIHPKRTATAGSITSVKTTSVEFNRRGTYVVTGHASGVVSVHDFSSRTLCSYYHPPTGYKQQYASPSMLRYRTNHTSSKLGVWNAALPIPYTATNHGTASNDGNYIMTRWSRNSRHLLVAHSNESVIRLIDNTHPNGPNDVTNAMRVSTLDKESHPNKDPNNTTTTTNNTNNDNSKPTTTNNKAKQTSPIKETNDDATTATKSTKTTTDEAEKQDTSTPVKKKSRLNPNNNHTTNHSNDVKNKSNNTKSSSSSLFSSSNHGNMLNKRLIQLDANHTTNKNSIKKYTNMKARLIPDVIVLQPTRDEEEDKEEKEKQQQNKEEQKQSPEKLSNLVAETIAKVQNTTTTTTPKATTTQSTSSTGSGNKKKKNVMKTNNPNKYYEGSTSKKWVVPSPRRYQTLVLSLPSPISKSVDIHPHDAFIGLACCQDGSIIIFRFPPTAFTEQITGSLKQLSSSNNNDSEHVQLHTSKSGALADSTKWSETVRRTERLKVGTMFYLPSGKQMVAAVFGGSDIVYGVDDSGTLMGWKIPQVWMDALKSPHQCCLSSTTKPIHLPITFDVLNSPIFSSSNIVNTTTSNDSLDPLFRVPIGTNVLHLKISRNFKFLLCITTDCTLRLYDTAELQNIEKPTTSINSSDKESIPRKKGFPSSKQEGVVVLPPINNSVKPRFVFQDLVGKTPWACCDFSGDGEYVVAGCNEQQPGDHYDLFLWNTATGALVDQLSGPAGISVQSISWHPTRSFIAVSTSDGLVDIWGPRMDWTAFAPDFQALPRNVEYIEKEDEFDTVILENMEDKPEKTEEEDNIVDVVTVEKIPVFDSDSEDETDIFSFETKVLGMMVGGRRGGGTNNHYSLHNQ